MAASSRALSTQLDFFRLSRLVDVSHLQSNGNGVLELRKRKRVSFDADRFIPVSRISCCSSDSVVPIRKTNGSGKSLEKCEEWRFDSKKSKSVSSHRLRTQASPAMPFASTQWVFIIHIENFE